MKKLWWILPLVILFACHHEKTCPTLAARPLDDLPVIIQAPKLPCILPALPLPAKLVGMASPDGIVLTKSDALALLAYLEQERAWIAAAQLCLESK